MNAKLHAASFAEAVFGEYEGARTTFTRSELDNATFASADMESTDFGLKDWTERGGNRFSNTLFDRSVIRGVYFDQEIMTQDTSFRGATLTNVLFRGCVLRDVDFTLASFHDCDFFEATLDGAKFERTSGLETCHNLVTTKGNPYNLEQCSRPFWEKWADWERVRFFGRLRLLGVSYTALGLVVLYVYALQFYNDKVEIAQSWAEKVGERAARFPDRLAEPAQALAASLSDRLDTVDVPIESYLLLVGFVVLAIASTAYGLACPEEVKEFSKVQWKYTLNRPLIHYWGHSWKRRWLRVPTITLYLIGTALTGSVVVIKVFTLIWLLWPF